MKRSIEQFPSFGQLTTVTQVLNNKVMTLSGFVGKVAETEPSIIDLGDQINAISDTYRESKKSRMSPCARENLYDIYEKNLSNKTNSERMQRFYSQNEIDMNISQQITPRSIRKSIQMRNSNQIFFEEQSRNQNLIKLLQNQTKTQEQEILQLKKQLKQANIKLSEITIQSQYIDSMQKEEIENLENEIQSLRQNIELRNQQQLVNSQINLLTHLSQKLSIDVSQLTEEFKIEEKSLKDIVFERIEQILENLELQKVQILEMNKEDQFKIEQINQLLERIKKLEIENKDLIGQLISNGHYYRQINEKIDKLDMLDTIQMELSAIKGKFLIQSKDDKKLKNKLQTAKDELVTKDNKFLELQRKIQTSQKGKKISNQIDDMLQNVRRGSVIQKELKDNNSIRQKRFSIHTPNTQIETAFQSPKNSFQIFHSRQATPTRDESDYFDQFQNPFFLKSHLTNTCSSPLVTQQCVKIQEKFENSILKSQNLLKLLDLKEPKNSKLSLRKCQEK